MVVAAATAVGDLRLVPLIPTGSPGVAAKTVPSKLFTDTLLRHRHHVGLQATGWIGCCIISYSIGVRIPRAEWRRKDLDAAGLSYIVSSRVAKAPTDLASNFHWHGDVFTDGQMIGTVTPRHTKSTVNITMQRAKPVRAARTRRPRRGPRGPAQRAER